MNCTKHGLVYKADPGTQGSATHITRSWRRNHDASPNTSASASTPPRPPPECSRYSAAIPPFWSQQPCTRSPWRPRKADAEQSSTPAVAARQLNIEALVHCSTGRLAWFEQPLKRRRPVHRFRAPTDEAFRKDPPAGCTGAAAGRQGQTDQARTEPSPRV